MTDDYPSVGIFPRILAVLQQRCPRCLSGTIFDDTWDMLDTCPNCGLQYEREVGYFTGAMYLSYGLAGGLCIPLWLWLITLELPNYGVLLIIAGALLAAAPLVFRYSRIAWLHLDQMISPR